MKVASQTQLPACSVEWGKQGLLVRVINSALLVVIVRLLSGEKASPLISSSELRLKFCTELPLKELIWTI